MIQPYRVAVWRQDDGTMRARVLADAEVCPEGAQLYHVRAHYDAEAEAYACELALLWWDTRRQEMRRQARADAGP